jgi:DegV family protein with EDD domain
MPDDRSVAIVCDGCSSLSPEVAAMYGVHIVPIYVTFGTETYRDGVDLDADQFYHLLRSHARPPTTSQPTAEDFVETYVAAWREAQPKGAEAIVSIHPSVKMTATVNSAEAAKDRLPEIPIHVIDTQSISMGQGLIAIEAARAALAGKDVGEILCLVDNLTQKMNILFTVETLEYLHKGGRIGGAAALFGSLLSIKPVLAVSNGQVEPVEKPRTRNRAIGRLLDRMAEHVGASTAVHAAVLHCDAPRDAQALAEQVMSRFELPELMVAEAGPTIGTHGGPGTVGVVFYCDQPDGTVERARA